MCSLQWCCAAAVRKRDAPTRRPAATAARRQLPRDRAPNLGRPVGGMAPRRSDPLDTNSCDGQLANPARRPTLTDPRLATHRRRPPHHPPTRPATVGGVRARGGVTASKQAHDADETVTDETSSPVLTTVPAVVVGRQPHPRDRRRGGTVLGAAKHRLRLANVRSPRCHPPTAGDVTVQHLRHEGQEFDR